MTDIYQTIGACIRRARENLKMSQADLAARLGFQSAATISYYETGERKISIVDLQRIAQTLGLPVESFLGKGVNVEDTRYLRFRALQVRPTARDAVVSFLAFARANGVPSSPALRVYSRLQPREAAIRLLSEADITEPPVSPAAISIHLGVPVYEWNFPDEISGLVVCEGGKVCIGINEEHSKVRQRFSTAHELGHLVLDWEQDLFVDFEGVESVPRYENDAEYLEQEKRANWFAADLLMPSAWLREDFAEHQANLPLLSKRYEVSQQALWFRLLSLKLIEVEQPEDNCP
jgi:Zn-dependent peptidase ImmA (M78 family)/transcriptional regulator with XRE-family HTH domain